jgi:hypothetical protein
MNGNQRIFKRFNSQFCIHTPLQVAERAIATQLLLTRSIVEQSSNQIAFDTLKSSTKDLKLFTPKENSLLQKSFKSWTTDEIINTQKHWESFGVLLWTLRIFQEIPREPDYFPKEKMYQSTGIIPAMPITINTFLDYFHDKEKGFTSDHFITTGMLKDEVNVCEAWYWRTRAQIILDFKKAHEEGRIPNDKIQGELKKTMNNITDAVKFGTETAHEKKYLEEIVDEDFGVGGVAFKNLDDHKMRELSFRYEKRMATLGWLCGTHEWDYEGDLQFINPMGSLFNPE